MRFVVYNYKGSSYTLDLNNWQMTVFSEEYREEFTVTEPKLVAEVMTLGEKVERQ